MKRSLLLPFFIAFSLTAAIKLYADTTVVAVVHENRSALFLALEAELRQAGFSTVSVPVDASWGRDSAVALRDTALRCQASAAVRILSTEKGALVYILDPASDVVVSSEVTAPEVAYNMDTVIALKTVEILRTGLLDVQSAKVEASASTPQTSSPGKAPVPASEPPEGAQIKDASVVEKPRVRNRFAPMGRVYAAPALSYGFGNIPPAFQAVFGVSFGVVERFRAAVCGLVPTFPSTVTRTEGSAVFREGTVSIGATFDLQSPERAFVPYIGVGGGVLIFHVEAEAETSFSGRNSTEISGEIHGNLGGTYRLNRIIGLRGEISSGIVVPRPVIRFDGNAVAAYGRPMLVGMLGIDIALF